jgi:hypothetical protein
MSYEPKLQRSAADKANAYLKDTYRNRLEFFAAVEEFRLALLKLAASPRLAVAPPGLFETRPVYRFTLKADGEPRDVEVCFCFDHEDPRERTILITDFRRVG